MKTIKIKLLTMFLIAPLFVLAQESPTEILNVKLAKTPIEFIQARNQLERLSLTTTQNWHTYYYLAYCDIQLSFMLPIKEDKIRYLTNAENYLKMLSDIKEVDPSELNTLKGFRLYAMIASDPQTNGPKYCGEITMYYEKALQMNANNPRAILLLALFKNDMANFMHQKYENLANDLDKAAKLLANEEITSIKPTWGKEWIERGQKGK